MKKQTYLFPIILLLISCSEFVVTHDTIPRIESTTTTNIAPPKSTNNLPLRFNFLDTNGMKQGVWIIRDNQNKIKKIETFLNDTLNGYWYERENGFQLEGHYKNGVRNGYFWYHRLNRNRLNRSKYNMDIYQQFLYKNDTLLWCISPETDMGFLVPIRGLTSTLDSIYAKAVYRDGSNWYEGAIVHNKSKGIHQIYFPNGKLYGKVDYDNNLVTEYDSLGNFVRRENINFYQTHRGKPFSN